MPIPTETPILLVELQVMSTLSKIADPVPPVVALAAIQIWRGEVWNCRVVTELKTVSETVFGHCCCRRPRSMQSRTR